MFFATDSQIKKQFKICESVANFSIEKLISQSFSLKIKPMHFKFILIYLGVPSFRTSLLRLKQSLNSVGHSATSPRQVPLSLHLSVGFLLQSLTRTSRHQELAF